MPFVAVSGLGSIGRQHVRALASRGDVRIAVFDPAAELREQARAMPGVTDVCATFDELLDREPEALIVAGPDHVHLDQLAQGLRRRVPTLVEKPLAPSYGEAAEAAAGLRATGVPVVVGYVLRHRAAVRTVHRLLTEGAVGDPVSFQVMLGAKQTIAAAVNRFATPETGRLYRDYSHEWDYLRWFFGPVSRAFARARTIDGVGHDEAPNAVDGLLEHASGVVGAVHIDYVEPYGVRTLHVVGTGGSIVADLRRGLVTVRDRSADEERRFVQPEEPGVGLRNQADHLIEVAQGKASPVVGLDDGIAALAVVDALQRSADTDRWTPLPAD